MSWPWEQGTAREIADGLRRRSDEILERAQSRRKVGGDWRPVLYEMARLLNVAAGRLEVMHAKVEDLELQRTDWNKRFHEAETAWRKTNRDVFEESLKLSEKIESLKRDNATMWTELLRYRNARGAEQASTAGRNYFED